MIHVTIIPKSNILTLSKIMSGDQEPGNPPGNMRGEKSRNFRDIQEKIMNEETRNHEQTHRQKNSGMYPNDG